MYIHVHTYFHFGMNFNHDVKKEGLGFLGNHTRLKISIFAIENCKKVVTNY